MAEQDITPPRADLPHEVAEAEYEVRRTEQAHREAKEKLRNALNQWAKDQALIEAGSRITIVSRRHTETWEVQLVIGSMRWDELRVMAVCANIKKSGATGERKARFVQQNGKWERSW